MLCPVCQHDNLEGEDSCENCGSDLRSSDIPEEAISFGGRLLGPSLAELSVSPFSTIEPGVSAAGALARMRDDATDCLLVMSGERLVGIFTDRDAILKLAGRRIEAFDVRDVMTADPVVLRHDDTLAIAINKMAVGGFRHIPIVQDGRPYGVIAARDVFRHIAASLDA